MLRLSPALHRAPLLSRPLSTASHAPSLLSHLKPKHQPIFPRPLGCLTSTSTNTLLRGQLLVRGAASHVSGRPGSQTAGQAAQNIKEEVGNSTADLAKAIAGGNVFQDAVAPTSRTFVRVFLIDCEKEIPPCLRLHFAWMFGERRLREL